MVVVIVVVVVVRCVDCIRSSIYSVDMKCIGNRENTLFNLLFRRMRHHLPVSDTVVCNSNMHQLAFIYIKQS